MNVPKVNRTGRRRACHAIDVDMSHNIVSSALLLDSCICKLLVGDVLVGTELLNGLVANVDAKFLLGLPLY